jgi:ABC-type multidrug transport system fused ATPase/permease subunit
VRDVTLASLRSHIALVSQETALVRRHRPRQYRLWQAGRHAEEIETAALSRFRRQFHPRAAARL